MIDLHIHSIFSDGTDTIQSIVEQCERRGLEVISITDHDTVDAYLHMDQPFYDKLLPGVEVKTSFEGIPIEVLGYGIDPYLFKDSPCVSKENKLSIQKKYLQNYIDVGNRLGIIHTEGLSIQNMKEYAAVVYYEDIKKYPQNMTIIPELLLDKKENFYRNTSGNKNSPFYIDESQDSFSLEFVISEIHRCGGLAFLAHLYQYKVEDHLAFLKRIFSRTDIDGCEAYYSTFTKEQTEQIILLANSFHKFISGGTDSHGKNKAGIQIGVGYGELSIPNITEQWSFSKSKNRS